MAIVKMKRVDVVGPVDMVRPLLGALHRAAVLDPVPLGDASEPPAELTTRLARIRRVRSALAARRSEQKQDAPPLEPEADADRGRETVARMERLTSRHSEFANRRSGLLKDRSQLAPWGSFSPDDVRELSDAGAFLRLFAGSPDEISTADLTSAAWSLEVPLGERSGKVGLAVIGLDAPSETGLETVTLPARSLAAVEADLRSAQGEIEEIEAEMNRLSCQLPSVERWEARARDHIRLAEVRAGLGGDEELFALTGWCPAAEVHDLEQALEGLPVALLVSEPSPDDDVPIALRNGPLVRVFEPLLKAFALPHYREFDPTLFIAPFMGLFFGFCLGDLGYGFILTTLAIIALVKLQPSGVARLATQWLVVLGLSTALIGGLTGNLFGVKLFEAFDLDPGRLLFVLNDDVVVFFWASMAMGVVQLMVGMSIKLVRQIQLGQWQRVIGSLGWLSVLPIFVPVLAPTLWGTEELLPAWSMLIPALLILLFESPSPSMVRRLGGGAWGVYNIIGLFGDVMSYIRIFGLGLSSAIIAMVVNTIAMSMTEDGGVVGWALAIVILVVGHLFNFAMAMIGSVVHPARLQFLEYFGKFFEGGGRAYAPFARMEGE